MVLQSVVLFCSLCEYCIYGREKAYCSILLGDLMKQYINIVPLVWFVLDLLCNYLLTLSMFSFLNILRFHCHYSVSNCFTIFHIIDYYSTSSVGTSGMFSLLWGNTSWSIYGIYALKDLFKCDS